MVREKHSVTIARDVFMAEAYHRTVKVAWRCASAARNLPPGQGAAAVARESETQSKREAQRCTSRFASTETVVRRC